MHGVVALAVVAVESEPVLAQGVESALVPDAVPDVDVARDVALVPVVVVVWDEEPASDQALAPDAAEVWAAVAAWVVVLAVACGQDHVWFHFQTRNRTAVEPRH